VKLCKDGILALASAIERNALEPKGHDRTHASLAREVCVTLATIANSLAPWDFRAVMCDRAPCLRSSTHSFAIEHHAYDQTHMALCSITMPTIERTPDLAAHLILFINRTFMYFVFFYVLGSAPMFLTM
jgi:hypothetical protein